MFDVDDTLYLERDYVRSGLFVVAAAVKPSHLARPFFDAAWSAFESGVRGVIFDTALRSLGLPADATTIERLRDVYRSHRPAIRLLDDAAALVAGLRAARRPLAVITDGPRASQRNKLEALGVFDWARPAVVTEELGEGRGKPHPAAFEAVEAATGCRGEDCCYIADNPVKDFVSPHAMGWLTVRLRRPRGLHSAIPSGSDVHRQVAHLRDLSI